MGILNRPGCQLAGSLDGAMVVLETTSSTKRTLANGFEYQYPEVKQAPSNFIKGVNLAAVDLIA